jgi:hypothetical protein
MKAWPILAAIAGVAAMAALVGYFGAGAVMRSLLAVGGAGFIAICAIHLVLIAAMGLAWRALLPGAPAGTVMWARLVRDSGSEALPLSQVGGYVLGARALALAGLRRADVEQRIATLDAVAHQDHRAHRAKWWHRHGNEVRR